MYRVTQLAFAALLHTLLLTACGGGGGGGGTPTTEPQDPELAFTTPAAALPKTLASGKTHRFRATSKSSGAITWSVTDTSDQATNLATIGTGGLLTASAVGTVKVTAPRRSGGSLQGGHHQPYLRYP